MGLFDGRVRLDGSLAGSRMPDAFLRSRTSIIFGDQGRATTSSSSPSWERCISDNGTAAATVTGGKFSRGQWEATTEIEDRRESRMAESTFHLKRSASESGLLETGGGGGGGGDGLPGKRSLSLVGKSTTVDEGMGFAEEANASSGRILSPRKDGKKGRAMEDTISWKDKLGWMHLGGVAFPNKGRNK
jgi:hypothetical protein